MRVNRPPVAIDDTYEGTEDHTLPVSTVAGVLANDEDPDGDAILAFLVQGPTHGWIAGSFEGDFEYHPDADWNGTDTFTYAATDGLADSAPATVTLVIGPVNDDPVADGEGAETLEDTPVDIDVLSNDTDIDGDTLSVSAVGPGAHGATSVNTDGTVRYNPSAQYHGSDSFSYTASDGHGGTADATVGVVIASVPDAPTVGDDDYSVLEDHTLTVTIDGGVLSNDVDHDGDTLTARLGDTTDHGTLELSSDGTFVYSPAQDFNGVDEFTYYASDGGLETGPGTASIQVEPENDAPTAQAQSLETDEDTPIAITLSGNDSDGDSLTFAISSDPANGSLTGLDATSGPSRSGQRTPRAMRSSIESKARPMVRASTRALASSPGRRPTRRSVCRTSRSELRMGSQAQSGL